MTTPSVISYLATIGRKGGKTITPARIEANRRNAKLPRKKSKKGAHK
jgi:hypothetical protein